MKINKRSKPFKILCTLLLIVPVLSGCWDRQEIEERAVILGIGVDSVKSTAEQGTKSEISHISKYFPAPKTGLIRVTVQIAVPGRIPLGPGGEGGGGGGGGQKTVWVVDVVGHTINDALNTLQQRISAPLFFGHLRVIVISETAARRGIENMNDYFRRNPEIRRMNWMVISKGKASDIMNASPQLERVPSIYLMTTMDQMVKMGKLPNVFLGRFWSSSSSKGMEGYLPYVKLEKKQNVQILGLAYFRGDRIVGTTAPIEIPLYMAITGMNPAGGQAFVKIPGSNDYVVFTSKNRKATFRVSIRNGRPHFNVKIFIEGNLIEKANENVKLSNLVIQKIENQLKKDATTGYTSLIKKTQKKGSDIYGFGEYVRAKESKYWNKHIKTKQNWQKMFPDVSVDIKVRFSIRRIGMKAT